MFYIKGPRKKAFLSKQQQQKSYQQSSAEMTSWNKFLLQTEGRSVVCTQKLMCLNGQFISLPQCLWKYSWDFSISLCHSSHSSSISHTSFFLQFFCLLPIIPWLWTPLNYRLSILRLTSLYLTSIHPSTYSFLWTQTCLFTFASTFPETCDFQLSDWH